MSRCFVEVALASGVWLRLMAATAQADKVNCFHRFLTVFINGKERRQSRQCNRKEGDNASFEGKWSEEMTSVGARDSEIAFQ